MQHGVLGGACVSNDSPAALENHRDGSIAIISLVSRVMVGRGRRAMPLQNRHRDEVFGFDDDGGH